MWKYFGIRLDETRITRSRSKEQREQEEASNSRWETKNSLRIPGWDGLRMEMPNIGSNIHHPGKSLLPDGCWELTPGVFHVSNIQEIPQLQLRRNHTERQRELKNWEFTWNTENTSVIPFNFMLRCEEKTWEKTTTRVESPRKTWKNPWDVNVLCSLPQNETHPN